MCFLLDHSAVSQNGHDVGASSRYTPPHPPTPPSSLPPLLSPPPTTTTRARPVKGDNSSVLPSLLCCLQRSPCLVNAKQQTVRMAMSAAVHHSFDKVAANELNNGPRAQKTERAGTRPGVLKDPAPQRAVTVGYVAAVAPSSSEFTVLRFQTRVGKFGPGVWWMLARNPYLPSTLAMKSTKS